MRCDSLLENQFDATTLSTLEEEMYIEKDYITSAQYNEFEAKFVLLKEYATMALELKKLVDTVNENSNVKYDRTRSSADEETRKKRILVEYDKYKIDATRFEGLVYLSGLYSRFQAAYEKDPLKETGELEAVEQEIMKVAEQAELYNK
jgi:hypothetical protein